jgi:hypothetical protein
MAQLDVLRNSTQLLNTLKGPAKVLYATINASMPGNILQVVDPTLGVPATPWRAFGLTRGGINWSVNIQTAQRDDIDQILGTYDQDVTDFEYTVSTQLAEVLDRTQLGMAFKMGVPTYVLATASQPTQVMVPLADGSSKFLPWRIAVVYPYPTPGKVMGFVFRNAQLSGGEKPIRFDRADSASPPLEIRGYPELSTTITADDAYGRLFMID